jgi:hypothetical protein
MSFFVTVWTEQVSVHPSGHEEGLENSHWQVSCCFVEKPEAGFRGGLRKILRIPANGRANDGAEERSDGVD